MTATLIRKECSTKCLGVITQFYTKRFGGCGLFMSVDPFKTSIIQAKNVYRQVLFQSVEKLQYSENLPEMYLIMLCDKPN